MAKQKLAPRPDRPARDAYRTRAAILDAATTEFARYGLGGARVDRISAAAGANKRMLYYYFGDKEGLFLAVLEAAYARIRSAEQNLSLLDLAPIASIRKLIRFTWNYFLAHPEFITLLNSENLHRASHLRKSRRARSLNSPLIATLGAVLERGSREGVFRTGVDPLQLYISIAGLCYFYLSNVHTLSSIFGRDLAAQPARAARLKHVTNVVLGYLRRESRTRA